MEAPGRSLLSSGEPEASQGEKSGRISPQYAVYLCRLLSFPPVNRR